MYIEVFLCQRNWQSKLHHSWFLAIKPLGFNILIFGMASLPIGSDFMLQPQNIMLVPIGQLSLFPRMRYYAQLSLGQV